MASKHKRTTHPGKRVTDFDIANCDLLPHSIVPWVISPPVRWHGSLIQGYVTSVHEIQEYRGAKSAGEADEQIA